MREMMWVYGVIIVLRASEVWSGTGTNQNTSVTSNTTLPLNSNVIKELGKNVSRYVNLGEHVNLTCTNKTWSELMYTIWNISLKSKKCRIASNDNGSSLNSCDNGKALYNTSSGESYLLIPNFSNSDEGGYKCESAYKAGSDSVNFNVFVRVPPMVSSWLEWQGKRLVAVCLAENGKPAASIVWKNMGNSSSVPKVNKENHTDGSYTVTSQLDLPEGVAPGNLTCVVGEEEQIMKSQTMKAAAAVPWIPLVISGVIIVILLGLLYLARKKLITIRNCQQSEPTPFEAKSPPAEDVDEVEPYASYIQRVNSIYNSSADLFT